MKFTQTKKFLSGVAVPLSGLKSKVSGGIGEFPDLVPLGQWCQKVGLSLIQILPINDTGYESSPYSALSAFALHPVYIRLSDLPQFDLIKAESSALVKELNALPRVSQETVMRKKLPLFRRLFEADRERAGWADELSSWMKKNGWAKAYAVFCSLKHRNNLASWLYWPEHQTVTKAKIDALWKTMGAEAEFFLWLQIHAEEQLVKAVKSLDQMGVALKGDLPILLNDDSADVWAHPELFDLTWRAGAPPDGMNPDGQNWGFPVYRWENLAKEDYGWWKDRLKQAAKFYHIYRIDHVLGFFRIWATPQENFTAQLGVFRPTEPIRKEQLFALGFDNGRIVWMSEPHVFGLEIRERLGAEADHVIGLALQKLGNEDLFKFSDHIKGEKALAGLPVSDHAKGCLIHWFRNRALIRLNENEFVTSANYFTTRAYDSLGNEERWNFERLVHECGEKSQNRWAEQGRTLLDFMKNTTDMLVCAEDLGSIPACVPQVLSELGILGLKINRWARDWNSPGQPYFPVRNYPELSVCTPSVHDTSTLRQWWTEEGDHRGFLGSLGLGNEHDGPLTPELSGTILKGIFASASKLCILALQDYFLLEPGLQTKDPALERVNTPGTVGPENWSYRMKPHLEELLNNDILNQKLVSMTAERSAR